MIYDVLNLEPNVLSSELTSYNFLIYGGSSLGKTTLATELFPKHIILGAEYGFKGIPGAIGVPVADYYSLLQYAEQLDTDEARAIYDTIIIDTTSRIGEMIEDYVTSIYGKNTVGDCKNRGGAFPLINKFYNQAFNRLKARGYNFVYISHVKETEVKEGDTVLYVKSTPKMSDRLDSMISPEVDYVLFITLDKDGNRIVVTDSTVKNFAKRRTNLPLTMPLNAELFREEFVKGVNEKAGGNITTEKKMTTVIESKEKEVDYKELVNEIKHLGEKSKELNKLKEAVAIVNNGLGLDDNNNQRTLDMATQENLQALLTIKSQLEKLLK